jgi:hypothetical protein
MWNYRPRRPSVALRESSPHSEVLICIEAKVMKYHCVILLHITTAVRIEHCQQLQSVTRGMKISQELHIITVLWHITPFRLVRIH